MALNRIYKVVWSKTKGCYIVVSELAKRVGRNKAKAIVISSAAMAMAVSPVMVNTVGAAVNDAGTGGDTSVAWAKTSNASGTNAVAVGAESKATQSNAVAVGRKTESTGDSAIAVGLSAKASGNLSEAIGVETVSSGVRSIAIGYKGKAEGEEAVAIGKEATASKASSLALGQGAQATGDRATAIGQSSKATQADTIALGTNSKSTNTYTVAFGRNTEAAGQRSMAFGNEAKATANDTIAIGAASEAKKNNDIIIGKEAKSRDEGGGHSIAIGYNSTAGSDRTGAATDVTSTGKNTAAGGVAIGVSSYTGVNRNNTAINSSVAIGAGAGAGFRAINTDGIPTGNGTDPDDNATVLSKAFGNTPAEAGNKDEANRFNYQGVDINEGTAVGRNTRAIGDQAVALGAQSIAGQGAIAIGGNDITQFANAKYFMSNRTNFGVADVSDHDQSGTLASKTISQKYQELVGAALNTAYQATYAQNGSTVIGMQAHSTTPLGVAIGTNALVRKGAYGATAIGSGSAVQANAEAAVAIGMGSWVNGKFGVAAGTASKAEQSAVATGYKADAGVSAVSVGDESKAVASSVAVGQLAKAEKTADIAVGQGAVASGEQGAIAMGLGTQAQGDSSIMIGGSEITKVANQRVSYQKEKIGPDGKIVIKSTKKTETVGGEQVERTIRSVEMETAPGSIQDAYRELTNGATLDTKTLNYSLPVNKNGHGSISMGVHSLSTGDLGTAIGTGARVTKLGGVALGTGAISELQNGVAIGTGSRADSRSIGTRQTDISYDEEGHIVPFDSKKVAYTFYWAGGSNTSEGDVVSFGSPGAERQLKNVAAGRIADDSTDAINGSQLNSVTKRMSNGWSVEAEKDKTSSGVLKLNGALATKGTEVHSANGKTTIRENPGTATGKVDKIRLNDEVKIRVGDNLVLHQEDASRPVYEDPDNPDRQTGTRVTSKFTYSLNPELTGLKSAQFKNDAGDTTDINGAGVTVTPVTAGKQPVSLTTAGLNNGGNAISNVAGNLPSTKNNDATTGASNATTSQAAPTLGDAANQVNPTNAATVSDVLNAGWNLQGNNKAVDFVKPYDTVNFVNGDGTTATVESTDGKTSTVKYSVNLGDGLKKDDATNKITVGAADKSLTVGTDGVKVNPGDKSLKTTNAGLTVNTADKSLEVTNDGLKVKTDGTTITTDDTNGLKVNTGTIEPVKTGADSGTVKVKDNDAGKIATVDSVVNAVNSAAWIATSEKTAAGELGATPTDQSVKAGDKVTFEADKNIKITQAGSKFTFATKDNVSFDTVQVGGSEGPKFAKAADGSIKVSDKDGTEPVKITNVKDGDISADSKDAINGSQFHKLANNTIQLKGQTGDNAATETKKQELNKKGGIAFTVKSSDGTLLEVSAAEDTITLTPKTATLTTGTDGVPTANTTGGKLVTADQLVNTLKSMGWKATAGQDDKGTVTDATVELIKAGDTVTFKAGNNLAVKQAGKNFIYSLQKDLTDLTSAGFKNVAGDTTAINGDGVTITSVTNGKQPVSLTKDGLNNGGNPITNVGGNLDGAKTGTNAPTTSATAPTLGTGTDQVNKNNAATVGDVLNAGWNLQNNDAAKDFVKPYDTVNFVNGEGTTAVVETTTDQVTSKIKYNVNTGKGLEKTADNKITVKPGDKSLEVTDAGVAVKKADQSLEVTDDGLKVKTDNKTITTGKDGLTVNTGTVNAVEQGDKKGTVEVPTADAGKIATVDTVAKAVNNAAFTLKASANGGTRNAGSGVTTDGESIKAGSTIEMIAGKNLDVKHDANGKITFATVENPSFNTIQVGGDQGPKLSKTDDGNIKVSDKDGTNPVNITNVKSNLPDTQNSDTTNTATDPSNATTSKAAPNTTNKTGDSYINPNNAATVSDVLNAGWNLQGNGSAVDFVKPYDTVNFVNGVNTTAVVSTVDGKTSNVTYNVTGLPITYTDKDGNLVSKIGDEFYKVNDKGQPLDAKGNPSTKVNKDGKPVDDAGNVIDPINTTNNPVKTSLVNPAPEANKTGTTSPTTLDNVTSKLENYKADPVNGKEPAKNSLRDLTNTNVTDNTVATVGDIRNMGWIVSSDKTTGANGTTTATEYSEAVKNANEVRFVGEGSAIVSGKTDDKGVRTITVKVDSQTGLNKTVTPVNYTKADGTKVYPQEVDNGDGTKTVKFFENPDGTGKEIPKSDVVTSVNGPEGTKNPTTLKNVKNNIPNVNDGSKTITTPDGTETAGDVENINKAPLTAAQAAELANPKTKDGQTNPKYIGNNAATVSDVLNAGWNLQNNGAAKDFVKPYDTVNFINGLNTTAVVTTSDDGTTSNVTYNVTGLPVTYTTEDGTPVTKIGDKYYKVNDQGQPVDDTGAPVTKFNKDGKPLDANGQEVPDVNITDKPLKTSLVNPAPETNKTGTTSPTSLSNVKNNIPTVNDEDKTAHKADGTAIGGKNNTEAPITAGDAANLLKPIVNGAPNPNFVGNNAATVSDVLNAGWNLQNNGTAKDFVKPYDTVNFVNGGNTTAVVTTNAAGTASDVTFNVTGLPVTYTTEDGAPVSKVGDKYYKVNDKGQPISDAGKPAVGTNNDGKLVDENNNVIEPVDTTKPLKTALVNPTPTGDKPNTTTATQLGNVTSGLDKYGDTVDGKEVPGSTKANNGLVDLSKPANGDAPKVSDNTAATVGDLRNMGWIVSSNKTTGENGAVTTDEYSATVKNANEVKFVGEGTAVVSGKTDDQGVRTITVKVDDQTSTNNAVTPVVYTDKDGKQVYPTGKTDKDGNQIFNTKPDGKGEDVTGPVKTTINGPKGTTSPASLSNVKNNIPAVNDADKKVTNADGTDKPDAGNVANINKAPLTAEEAADLLKPTTKDGKSNPNFVGNNAATVSDVLNAGWNLQNNGAAKDFVKPFDTVNFVNGVNTTAVVTTSEDGTTSNVTYNVTGLPVTYTTADGTPVSKIGDKFYKVNDKGQPLDSNGKPATKINENGVPVGEDGQPISEVNITDTPLTSKLVNPNAKNTDAEPNKKTTDPTQLGNVTSGLQKYGDTVDGKEVPGSTKANNGLVDLSTPTDGSKPKVSDNTAATVGDLRNMGWIVSSDKTTGETDKAYTDTVKNANEVKFVGEGTAIVSGKTDDKGVRTITVKVDDQTSTNNSVTPVNYTKADGTKVYPKTVTDPKTGKEEVKFFENPDGSGAEVPKGDVVTSINGPEGTTSPTTLKNVKNNIPNVNDGSKTITNPDGTEKTGDVENINKAPLTAEEAAALANPKTKDGQANPKYIGNNAATVSDVLNAGWNLQNNGAARDFVKPFDTVNFVNGVNTTAVVTTSEDGTTSNVTYNVTGLPVTYTTADGTPVSKIGDDYYTVNDKGQPIDANGKPSTKVNKDGKPVDENGNVIKPIDTTANPLTSSLVNPNAKNTDAEPNKKTTDPTQLGNVTSGLQKYGDTVDGKEVPGSTKANNGLIDLSTPTDGTKPKVSDNTAATVGDLRNMGWIVSSDKTTGADGATTNTAYSEQVKNANEVKFVGKGTAIVSGKTDANGVRTITVKVDDQVSTNNSVTPVNYTKADGTKVYPKTVRDPKTGKEEVKFFENPDGSGAEVPKGDVVTSINGPEGTTSPTTLKNVKNNIPNVNDGSKTITTPDGKEKAGDVENINKAPLTAEEAAALANPKTKYGQANPKYIGNNAATVSDVLNAGWNLQNNGESRDFVKPYDTVNFVNGLGTTAVVTTREDNTASDVTFNVKAANGSVTVDENGVKVTTGEMKPAVGTDNKETGAIATPADPATAKQLKETLAAAEKDLSAAREALKEAEKALAADPKDPALQQAVADKKADVAAKQTPVDAAQKAHDEAGLNKVATVQNVAEAINNAGFNLKTSADGGEKLTGTKDDGELIKPSNTVEMVAGNNLTVKQDANGKITYATKDNVTFTNVDTGTLNVGSPNTYTDGKGNTYTKVGDHYYKPADVVNGAPKPGATPVDVTTTPVTPVSPVTMKAEAAKPATNNASDAQPSSALNVTSKDGKPTQITGVGSTLNTKSVDTTPQGTAPGTTPNTTPANLVDLEGTADAPVNKNAAATVGDLQNMGWVVSAKDGNGYKDVVKNANVVDFKGGKGIEITGKTLTDGTREITVGIKEGEVTNKVTITNANGTKTDAVKIGDNYYKVDKDGKPIGFEKGPDGKPAGTPLKVDPKTDKVTNAGAGFVTGNTVANAIQDSGWNVGIGSTDKDFSKDAKVYDKVNPNDDVKFANGANTNVSMVTVDALNEDGTKKATTFVKVDVNRDLKIDSVTTGGTAVDKNGNNLVKVGDDYYKESDIDPVTKQPKPNAKPVPKADVTPAKDGAMIVKNADGKDVVSATVGKDGSGAFAVKGKDGKDGISMTAKDGQGAIGVNGKDGATTTIKGDTITIKDKDGNTNTSTPTSNELKDTKGNTNTSTADKIELKDKAGNTNTSTPTTNVLKDTNGNTNTSNAAGTTYKDKDDNTAVVGPKEIALTDKSGDNKASFTNKDLIFNATDPKTGVEKTSHVSGDKIAFSTTDEMEKVFDKDGKPVIDPATGKQKEVVKMEKVFDKDGKPVIDPTTGKQKEVIKNPGNSTEYTNEGLKVIPNSTVARDANGNLTYVDANNEPVMKDKDGNFVYMGKDGKHKPGEKYAGAVGALKPNVVDNTRVISFGMDKPVLDKDGKPVTGPDGNPVMTEGISAGMQQMHNLAPGTKDTDAVNVSQLRGTTININNRINRSGAQAAALAGLQTIQYDPLEPTQVSAGLGYYQGASALALGVNHYKNESTLFHVGASFNGRGSETMANASVTWKFGARADETAVKDTFRQGPISASYTLQDKVSALEAQNQIQKDQLNELRATNAAQKAENEAQREELALVKAQVAELYKLLKG